LWHDELFRAKFRHKCMGKFWMPESVRCDHCEEDFAPEELVILDPPAGDGELICARCIEIMFRRAIAALPRGDN
jgi:formylmethanofuran dehydrogenase subunit E